MNHKMSLDFIIFWSSLLTVLVIKTAAYGILTDSNDIQCTHIQCPKKCPDDSYLQSGLHNEEADFDDYADELLGHDPYIEEIGHFEEIPPLEELHDTHSPQHILKERQKREVFFQEDIEKCCNDQKCVCNKCQDVPKCADGYVAVEILEGHGVPGNCCSIFRCIEKKECQLGVKQSWWTNKCRKCSCFGDNELCMQICPEEEILQNCFSEYWQKPMLNGAFWKEGSCTSCSCEQGERRCFTPVCPKLDCKETIRFDDECCPKCIGDEIDTRQEILNNNDIDYDAENEEEEYSTHATTIEDPIVHINKEYNSSISQDSSSVPAIEENATNATQTTTSPFVETIENSTALVIGEIINEIILNFHTNPNSDASSTMSNSNLTLYFENASSTPTNREESTTEVEQKHNSPIGVKTTTTPTTTTLESKSNIENENDSTTTSTSIEESKSIVIIQQDLSSTLRTTTKEVDITSIAPSSISEELTTKDDTTSEATSRTNSLEENSTITSSSFMENISKSEAARTLITTWPTVIPIEFSTMDTTPSSLDVSDTPTDFPLATSDIFSTSPVSRASHSTTESYATNMISSSAQPKTFATYSTNTPSDATSSPAPNIFSISTEYSTKFPTSATSTTSSPYLTSTNYTTTTAATTTTSKPTELLSSTSTTTSPEPLRPLFHSYDDFISNEGKTSTQNQMRIIFDEIDYVVMIALFIGSVLCISLGLIIRHTKNRKKMYSSIPNSETSLSQTSTNTVMTV